MSGFKPSKAGIREALSLPGVQDATYSLAASVAARANAMVSGECAAWERRNRAALGNAAFTPHRGSGSKVAVANVATSNPVGIRMQSESKVLHKAGGV